jgi:hypothetical protein
VELGENTLTVVGWQLIAVNNYFLRFYVCGARSMRFACETAERRTTRKR